MALKAAIAICSVFFGCCINVVFLELLVKADPGAGNLITFAQFFFIAIEGLVFTSQFFTKKPVISLKNYALLVLMFFVTSVCNNHAFNFNIPMPLHMIFRSGSLIANMIMGTILLKKRYVMKKYVSVFLITAGIIICTIVSGSEVKDTNPKAAEAPPESEATIFFWWTVGITLLTAALLISACMGIYQEWLYKTFGKHPREALFFTHLLPLPGFLLMYQSISEHFRISVESEPISLPVFYLFDWQIEVPAQLLYLLMNVITQYICINAVYVLTTECSSLTVTLVVTLRKFVSLLFSIFYFNNAFTIYHWIGTILVFVGTIIFTEILEKMQSKSETIKPTKTKAAKAIKKQQ